MTDLVELWDGNRIASNEAAEELAASQAREAKLREALNAVLDFASTVGGSSSWWEETWEVEHDGVQYADDDTALQQAIKQAKREALLEAAEWFNKGDPAWCRLKEMAEKIK
jgi:hypothetical protein